MNRFHVSLIAASALVLGLAACANTGSTPNAAVTACAAVAKVEASPDGAKLDKLDPHSAGGILWADAKTACPGGVPANGVNTAWVQTVVSALATAAPSIAPLIVSAL